MPVDRKPTSTTAQISPRLYCAACGWPVVTCCVNEGFMGVEGLRYDYWFYCANKGCLHHDGQSVDQDDPWWTAAIPEP